MLPLVIWVVTGAFGFLREVPGTRMVGEVCEGCGYSLSGLPERGVCPECGGGFDGNGPARRVEWGWRIVVLRPWLLAFTLVCVLAAGVWPGLTSTTFIDWLEARALIARGYRADVAWRAARMPSWGGACGGGLEYTPAAYVAAFLPLVGRMPGRWGWRVAISLAAVGLVGGAIGWLRFWTLV